MAKPSRFAFLRFCPKCGLDKLKRDYFPAENGNPPPGVKMVRLGCEYLCEGCGFSFVIGKSRREHFADRLHREHRTLRNGVTFTEHCVGKEVAQKFNESRPEPKWPHREDKAKLGLCKCGDCLAVKTAT